MNNTANVLVFQECHLDILDLAGEVWLRLGQIGLALGYSNPADLQKVYNRNIDEFDDSMTRVIELESNGGKQATRIFSLRGAHLLGMLAKTETAKAFRRWVLDVLHDYTIRARQAAKTKINEQQKDDIVQAVQQLSWRTGESPQRIYARFFRNYEIRRTEDLLAQDFDDALEFVSRPPSPDKWLPQMNEQDVLMLRRKGHHDDELAQLAEKNKHLLSDKALLLGAV